LEGVPFVVLVAAVVDLAQVIAVEGIVEAHSSLIDQVHFTGSGENEN